MNYVNETLRVIELTGHDDAVRLLFGEALPMEVLLSFFSVLKSEINWLISLVSSANTDTDQAQANVPAAHDNPATDHHAIGVQAAAVQDSPAADTATETASHHKGDAPQLLLAQPADDSNFTLHQAFNDASDDGADSPHGSGSFFAFDAFAGFDQSGHAAPAPSALSFTSASFDAFAANATTIGDLSIHPLPSLGEPNLFDDDDAIVSFKGGPSGSGGQGTGPSFTEYVTKAGVVGTPDASGLTFKLTFDQSSAYLTTQDANFQGAVEAVAKQLAGQFNNHMTVSIDIGYGEVDGFKLGSALGESITYYTTVTGDTAALQYANLQSHDSYLPGSDPLGTSKHTYWVTTAEGRALGVSASAPTYDGYIGLQSAGKQDFSLKDINGGAPASGEYDGIGTIAHEFTEVMGRQTLNGAKSSGIPGYMPLDLFHFSSATPGTHIYSGTTAGYFSLDGTTNGDTALATDTSRSFNTKTGDKSDWAPGTTEANPPDAYDASGGLNSVSPVSKVDFLVMEAVGWQPAHAFTSADVWG